MWKLKSKKSSPYGVAAAAQRRVKKIELGEDKNDSVWDTISNICNDTRINEADWVRSRLANCAKVDLSTHEGRSLVGYNYLEMED